MEAFKLKKCPNCKTNLSDQHQLCEYCGYHFDSKFDKDYYKAETKTMDETPIEVNNDFIDFFASEWGIEKDKYSHLIREEGTLCKLSGAAGLSEYTVIAFKLDDFNKEKFLNWTESSTIAESIASWQIELDGEDFFLDWDCLDIELNLTDESGKDIEILEKEFDGDSLTIEKKIENELKRLKIFEKYDYLILIDEFRKGEQFEELFKIRNQYVFSNFNNAIEINNETTYFYEMLTSQWMIKSIEYTFYKISNDIEYIGEEEEFIKKISN